MRKLYFVSNVKNHKMEKNKTFYMKILDDHNLNGDFIVQKDKFYNNSASFKICKIDEFRSGIKVQYDIWLIVIHNLFSKYTYLRHIL